MSCTSAENLWVSMVPDIWTDLLNLDERNSSGRNTHQSTKTTPLPPIRFPTHLQHSYSTGCSRFHQACPHRFWKRPSAAVVDSPDMSNGASWTFRLFPFSPRTEWASEKRSSQVEKRLSDDGGPAAEQAGRVLGHSAGLWGPQGDLGRSESGSGGSGVQWSRAGPGYRGWSQHHSAPRWGRDRVDKWLRRALLDRKVMASPRYSDTQVLSQSATTSLGTATSCPFTAWRHQWTSSQSAAMRMPVTAPNYL